ncbi:snare associated Golgi protein-domain-containing protein [Scenedesmus sp. NREL 46B-D3]|nr:snare associated Golgi protein-domain-containing protein [Scenedesmus sp. NREL 46B-D3]
MVPQHSALGIMARPARDIRASGDGYQELSSMGSMRITKPRFRRRTCMLRAAGIAVLLGLFIATSLTLGRKDNLHKVLLWVHSHRIAGFVIFCLLYIWFTVLFLPPALLAACAGAIYGFLPAIPLVWVCAVVGETVSFLLGRFLLKRWVKELTADWPMWTALDAALSEDGWKLVALLRVSPVVPFSIINYALGSSSLPFLHYWWPSVFGIIPSLVIYIYLGSLAADVSSAISGGGAHAAPPAAKVAIIVTGSVSALAVVVLSGVYTKRAIDKRLAQVHVHEEVEVEEQHFLLGSGGGSAAAAAADGEGGEAMQRVVVSVEAPRYVVERSNSREVAVGGHGEGMEEDDHGAGRGWGGGMFGGRWLRLFKQKARVSEDEEVGQHVAVGHSNDLPAAGVGRQAGSCSGHGSSGGAADSAAGPAAHGHRAGKQQHPQR